MAPRWCELARTPERDLLYKPRAHHPDRHLDGESIRTIARATKLSIGTVHTVLADHRAAND